MSRNVGGANNHSEDKWLPKRIILVRHGESKGNTDENTYGNLPDHKIPLTAQGIEQAKQTGTLIRELLDNSSNCNWKVSIYVSPYTRTRSTLREMGRAFPKSRVIGVREECRLREQDFGNFQDAKKMEQIKEIRSKFGRFFYRFPEGESGADVYDRVSNFLESLWRDIDMKRFPHDPKEDELNLVIVSHGLAIRIFLMKWFRWTVEQFEELENPKNGEFRVMQLGEGGEYSLAIHHDDAKLKEWGLSPEMIADQKLRAEGRDVQKEERVWFDAFFHHSEDPGETSKSDEGEEAK
ncbi:Phosphoglycerate mutase [Handroanthus impetiginosus]|uniref:Phosphoglycerate mutase n=1 Tax=Handroanthus impetiginosus TaxID=429701 RepID=A0A2G9HI69_9LAMI|nr:Phosphoglycerate mutase [Handroanthus impetiginosus]